VSRKKIVDRAFPIGDIESMKNGERIRPARRNFYEVEVAAVARIVVVVRDHAVDRFLS